MTSSRCAPGRDAAMGNPRVMFIVYCALIAGGLVLYSVVGLTHG
jgi:hypothetical protein